METVIGVLLIIMGIFLIISVLMQSSKNHRLSGSIAGGAETFFGKQKGKTLDLFERSEIFLMLLDMCTYQADDFRIFEHLFPAVENLVDAVGKALGHHSFTHYPQDILILLLIYINLYYNKKDF